MNNSNHTLNERSIIDSLYMNLLKRAASESERQFWVNRLIKLGFDNVVANFLSCEEYRNINGIDLPHPPGHFYSPIVSIDEIDRELLSTAELSERDLNLIGLSPDRMLSFWRDYHNLICSECFAENNSEKSRYYYNNPVFCRTDASILRAMIIINKPKNIVEIGSGFSSAVMLDTVEEFSIGIRSITFIDPYPERLIGLLKYPTSVPYTIINKPVQKVNLEVFSQLGPGDILFIDSSHILKTQSDVCFELFTILPLLNSGVVIHFHDIFYPFEYPADWVLGRRYSWNELYALRAFLMHNDLYEIIFFNHYFFKTHIKVLTGRTKSYTENPGGSLWIKKRE